MRNKMCLQVLCENCRDSGLTPCRTVDDDDLNELNITADNIRNYVKRDNFLDIKQDVTVS